MLPLMFIKKYIGTAAIVLLIIGGILKQNPGFILIGIFFAFVQHRIKMLDIELAEVDREIAKKKSSIRYRYFQNGRKRLPRKKH